jgi:Lsr2
MIYGQTEGAETIVFGWEREWREIDLAKTNLDKLTNALKPFLEKSRPADKKRLSSTTGDGSQSAIRQWAKSQGLEVPPRGRIPTEVVEKYEAAHKSA